MEEERRKAKRLAMGLFLACLCAALVCFGASAYIALAKRGEGPVNERIVTAAQIVVLAGIFFLVLAFGHLLPALLSHRKYDRKEGEGNMSEIFDEGNMRRALGPYIPVGESLAAGIHALAQETYVREVFGKCVRTESGLIPDADGGAVVLEKKKHSTYDIYLGITRSSLVMAECEQNGYYYQFEDRPDTGAADVREVDAEILFSDIGTCFPLADIRRCEIKKGWMGSVKCFITMKNGSYLKLMLPKLGGLGGGMPRHGEYREAIIARLNRFL